MASKRDQRSESALERRRSKEEGEKLEDDVFRFIRDAVGDLLQVFPKWPVRGSAGDWDADIAVSGPGDFDRETNTGTFGPLVAMVECKFSRLGAAGGSYSNAVERAYALLNFVKWENPGTRLFLVMNRLPENGETPRNTKVLLDKMGAGFINFGNESDRTFLRRELARLQPEG